MTIFILLVILLTKPIYVIEEDTLLGVTETTNDICNDDLWSLITPSSLLYWVRVMVANRMASTGEEWAEVFVEEQSGTYNNQVS